MSACVENPAARSHHGATVIARGRRGAPSHGLVTPAPTTHGPALPPHPAPLPTVEPDEDEPGTEPDVPPASMRVPIDDVDG
jgi:hypothetical protein